MLAVGTGFGGSARVLPAPKVKAGALLIEAGGRNPPALLPPSVPMPNPKDGGRPSVAVADGGEETGGKDETGFGGSSSTGAFSVVSPAVLVDGDVPNENADAFSVSGAVIAAAALDGSLVRANERDEGAGPCGGGPTAPLSSDELAPNLKEETLLPSAPPKAGAPAPNTKDVAFPFSVAPALGEGAEGSLMAVVAEGKANALMAGVGVDAGSLRLAGSLADERVSSGTVANPAPSTDFAGSAAVSGNDGPLPVSPPLTLFCL